MYMSNLLQDKDITTNFLLEDIFGPDTSQEQVQSKSGFNKIYSLFKDIVEAIKVAIIKLTSNDTVTSITDTLRLILSKIPFIGKFMQTERFKTLDDKVRYMKKTESTSDFFMKIFEWIGSIGKTILFIFNKLGIISDKLYYNSRFINDMTNTSNTNMSVAVYRQIYDMFKAEGVDEKYCRAYILSLAALAPAYYIMYTFSRSDYYVDTVAQSKQDYEEYIKNPITYTGAASPKTGLSEYHKRLLKDASTILEKYKREEDPLKKNHILSKEMTKKFLSFIVWMVFIFVPAFPIGKFFTGNALFFIVYKILAVISILIIIFHSVYVNFALL